MCVHYYVLYLQAIILKSPPFEIPVAKPFSRKPLNHMRVDCVSWLRLNARMLREISASAHAHNVEYVAERSSLSFHVKSFKDDNFMLCQI